MGAHYHAKWEGDSRRRSPIATGRTRRQRRSAFGRMDGIRGLELDKRDSGMGYPQV